MRLVGVTNTGKFNYHLNILSDLIEKDENGKYGLSDKGRLVAHLLEEFGDNETEPVRPPTSMKAFETRAFSLAQGFIWVVLLYPLTWILFGWYLYFVDRVGAFVGDPLVPLMIFTVIIGGGFGLFGMAAFPKIRIDRDGAEVKSGFVRRFFALEEIRIDPKGHVLKLGEGLTVGGWFILFRERECVGLLKGYIRTYRSKPFFLTYLLPTLIVGFYFELMKYLGGTLSPVFWAFSWGTTATVSMSIFVYGVPGDMRIGNMHRGVSAIVFGLSAGILIFVLVFLGLQNR
jgi:hypothetical protein